MWTAHLLQHLDWLKDEGGLLLVGLDASNKVRLGPTDHFHEGLQRGLGGLRGRPTTSQKGGQDETRSHAHARLHSDSGQGEAPECAP